MDMTYEDKIVQFTEQLDLLKVCVNDVEQLIESHENKLSNGDLTELEAVTVAEIIRLRSLKNQTLYHKGGGNCIPCDCISNGKVEEKVPMPPSS